MAKGCGRLHHIQIFYLLQKDHYQADQKRRGDCRNGSYAKMTHKWPKQAYARGVAYVGKFAIIEDIALKHLQLKHLLNHPSHNHSNKPLQLKLLLSHPSHHHSNQPLQLKLLLSHPSHHHSNKPLQLKLQLSHPNHHHNNQPLHYHSQVHNLHNLLLQHQGVQLNILTKDHVGVEDQWWDQNWMQGGDAYGNPDYMCFPYYNVL